MTLTLKVGEKNYDFTGDDAIARLLAVRETYNESGQGNVILYRHAFINLEQRDDGWWCSIKYPNFNAHCGNFVGPNTALATATRLIDVVMDEIL